MSLSALQPNGEDIDAENVELGRRSAARLPSLRRHRLLGHGDSIGTSWGAVAVILHAVRAAPRITPRDARRPVVGMRDSPGC